MSLDMLFPPMPTGGVDVKNPINNMRVVMFAKMMVHPETKQMVMVPMQDIQYQRQGSTEWFSMPLVELEKHEFNPEEKSTGIITNEG